MGVLRETEVALSGFGGRTNLIGFGLEESKATGIMGSGFLNWDNDQQQ